MIRTSPFPEQMWEFPFADALVLARPDLQGLFILNPSAAQLWHALRNSYSVEEIAQEFSLHYSIPLSTALADITGAITAWSNTLLQPTSGALAGFAASQTSLPSTAPTFVDQFSLNGRTFRLEIQDEDLIEEIAPRLSPLRVASAAPDHIVRVFRSDELIGVVCDGRILAVESSSSAARSVLLPEIVRLSEGEEEWLAILHAGACGTSSHCVLLAAPSHSGKSTLVAALVHAGLTFYSDDSVPLQKDTCRVVTMPFPLMVREGSWTVLQSRYPELGHARVFERTDSDVRFLSPPRGANGSSRAEAKALVFSQFTPGAPTQLRRLDFLDCLLHLQESKFSVAHDPDSIGAFLTFLHSLPAYRLTYSDLDEAVLNVKHLLYESGPPVAQLPAFSSTQL